MPIIIVMIKIKIGRLGVPVVGFRRVLMTLEPILSPSVFSKISKPRPGLGRETSRFASRQICLNEMSYG